MVTPEIRVFMEFAPAFYTKEVSPSDVLARVRGRIGIGRLIPIPGSPRGGQGNAGWGPRDPSFFDCCARGRSCDTFPKHRDLRPFLYDYDLVAYGGA